MVCSDTWVKFRGSCYNFQPVVLRVPLEEAREHCRRKGTTGQVRHVVSRGNSSCTLPHCDRLEQVWFRCWFSLSDSFCSQLCTVSVDNVTDILTIRDEEETRFFLEEMKNFYDGFETVWLGIYYNTDSKKAFLHQFSLIDSGIHFTIIKVK